MSPSDDGTISILAAGYGSVSAAVADFDVVSGLSDEADAAGYFDAAVINPHETEIASRVVRKLEPSGHQAGAARAEGLAARVGHYVFEGLALVGGAAGGGGQELLSDDPARGRDAEDLEKLGAVQKAASAVLIVIFPTQLAGRVAASITPVDSYTSKDIHASAEELAAQVTAAEQRSIAGSQSGRA